MRILLVSHNFLPGHRAGTEIYTGRLGGALQELGHEVRIFTTEKDISRRNLSVERRVVEGLQVTEVVNNLYYRQFRETWDFPEIEGLFRDELDEFKPDVVHFQHLLYLSVGCVEEAAGRGLPVLFTLHDYWLQCPRQGQRVHADGDLCHTIEFDRCGSCLADFKFGQSTLQRKVGKGVAMVRTFTGLDLGPHARRTATRWISEEAQRELEQAVAAEDHTLAVHASPAGEPPPQDDDIQQASGQPEGERGALTAGAGAVPGEAVPGEVGEADEADEADEAGEPGEAHPLAVKSIPGARSFDPGLLTDDQLLMARAAAERDWELRARLDAAVWRFISPSGFLRDRFLEWGVKPERLLHLPTGIDLKRFDTVPHAPRDDDLLRVSFIGSLIPAKGPHILLDAWGLLSPEGRERGRLRLYGPMLHGPDFVADLSAGAKRVGAEVRRSLEPHEVPGVLRRTDLLVVPSLWFENSPLIILEAQAAGTPVLVSDLGGMAELVDEGVTGFVFPMGDRRALAERLDSFLLEPRDLRGLRGGGVHVPRASENIDRLVELYHEGMELGAGGEL